MRWSPLSSGHGSAAGPKEEFSTQNGDLRPIAVVIGGFLCAQPRSGSFWRIPMAALEAHGFRVILVKPTPVGSLHDSCELHQYIIFEACSLANFACRACQAFYQLKGGTVCYGQEHSRLHGHDCHGETYPGIIPAWGAGSPVHIVGHSYGGQTARVLQHLIAIGFFSKAGEYRTTSGWVRSVTACNTPLNGSLLVYTLGEKSDAAPAVRLGSYGHLLSLVIHVLELLDMAFLRNIFYPGLEHFGLSWRRLGLLKAVGELLRAVAGNSIIFSREDNAAFDITVHSAYRWNQVIQTDPNTFYFSVCGTMPPTCNSAAAAINEEPGARVSPGALSRMVPIRLTYWFLRWTHDGQVRKHEKIVENLFGVPAEAWSVSGSDGVLEGYTQSHPCAPSECKPPVSLGGLSLSLSGKYQWCCGLQVPSPVFAEIIKQKHTIGFTSEHGTVHPGVWHCISCPADHSWAFANKGQAKEIFERLARCLLATNNLKEAATLANRNIGSRAISDGAQNGASLLLCDNSMSAVNTPRRRSARVLAQKRHRMTAITTSSAHISDQSSAKRPTTSRTATISASPMLSGSHKEQMRRELDGGGGDAEDCDLCNNRAVAPQGKFWNDNGKFRDGRSREAPEQGRRNRVVREVSRERGLVYGRTHSLVRILLLTVPLLIAMAFCMTVAALRVGAW